MANSPQAIKRARQNDKKRANNTFQRTNMRTKIKKTLSLITTGDKDAATAAYRIMVKALDTMANKKLLPKNKAARLKSRINAKLKAIA